MRRRPRCNPRPESTDLAVRARRLRRRGDARKALLTMRAACYEDGDDPRLWAQYGHFARLSGKFEEASEAFAHAIWLFERRHQHGRASAVRGITSELNRADRAA